MLESSPYLSLVIPTRNDDYPSNRLPVQNKCLQILQNQLEDAGIESEIILVEYNSEASKRHLWDSLRVGPAKRVTIRVIAVAPEHHRRFVRAESIPFHQTLAINIGLRRARGQFAAYRAADHIYSAPLVGFLAGKGLAENKVYRCDRFDIDPAAVEGMNPGDPDEVSRICEAHIAYQHKPLQVPPWYHIPTLHTNACGDFLLMSAARWRAVKGLHEGRRPIFLDYDSLVLHASHARGAAEEILPPECRVYKVDHGMKSICRIEAAWSPAWRQLDAFLMGRTNNTFATWMRILFNYPRRRDSRAGHRLLDSYERHFLLPAWLWARRFPVTRQNLIRWGLGGERLPEKVLARAVWDSGQSQGLKAI